MVDQDSLCNSNNIPNNERDRALSAIGAARVAVMLEDAAMEAAAALARAKIDGRRGEMAEAEIAAATTLAAALKHKAEVIAEMDSWS